MRAQARHSQAVREQDMVARPHSQLFIAHTRSMDAQGIAEIGGTPGFVMCEPPLNAVSQAARHHLRVVGEGVSRIANKPAAAILQGHWQIPVVERGERTNAASEQGVNQAVIKIQAAFVDSAGPLWQNARPGEREAVGVQVELGHERNIFSHPVIVVRRDLPRLALVGSSRRGGEAIPHRKGASIFMRRSFYLVG